MVSFPEFSIISSQGTSLLGFLQVSQHAMLLALVQAVSPQGRVLLCTLDAEEGSGFFLRAPWATALGSAAPPAGLQGLGPQLDPSVVSIFMGIQGWDLAACGQKGSRN